MRAGLTCFSEAKYLQQQPANAPERGGWQRLEQQQRAKRIHIVAASLPAVLRTAETPKHHYFWTSGSLSIYSTLLTGPIVMLYRHGRLFLKLLRGVPVASRAWQRIRAASRPLRARAWACMILCCPGWASMAVAVLPELKGSCCGLRS